MNWDQMILLLQFFTNAQGGEREHYEGFSQFPWGNLQSISLKFGVAWILHLEVWSCLDFTP